MGLTPYDPALHHIGIGPAADPEGDVAGYLIQQPYISEPQRQSAPAIFGTPTDGISARVRSRWTQDDFSGGAFQEDWGSDPAMFKDCDGMIPAFLDRSIRTCPPLVYWSSASGTARPARPQQALGVFTTEYRIAVVFFDFTYYYDFETGARTSRPHAGLPVMAACHDPGDNYVYSVAGPDGSGDYFLRRYSSTTAPVTISQVPDGFNGPPAGICPFLKDFLVCMGTTLYLADVADNRASANWTKIGRLPGRWVDACFFNGLVYILTTSSTGSALYAWDGQQILPVTDIPFNFRGECLEAFGGRLFIGGSGLDIGPTDEYQTPRYAEFYEVVGASLRQTFSFSDVARKDATAPSVIHTMHAHEGFLWLGTDRDTVMVYDLTRDSIFNGPRVVPDPAGHDVGVFALCSAHEKLFAFCYDHDSPWDGTKTDDYGSAIGADGFYRMATADSDVAATYSSSVTLSHFTPEADRAKRWSDVKVTTRFGTHTVEVSQDAGLTWEEPDGVVTQQGDNYFGTWDLSDLDVSNSLLVRVNFDRDDAAWTELLATTVHFLILDDGKWGWSFTIIGALGIEAGDGTMVAQDVLAIREELRGYVMNKTPLTFIDLDQREFKVTLTDFVESQPVIAPPGTEETPPVTREGLYKVTLTEV